MEDFKPELLAPAGNLKVLKAAVNTGADAVYFGLDGFNARNGAKNFDESDAAKGMDYLKLRGKKGYVTLNTLVKDSELQDFKRAVICVNNIGADGIIVQDFGAVNILKKMAPHLELHASTQMAIHNLNGVKCAAQLGLRRIVPARELTLSEILYIKNNTDCEIEVFIHGALCVCYSGRCYMSSFIGGRSGNRGRCAQPCRLNYSIEGKEGSLISLKDLQSVDYIPKLIKGKIDSFKIEGRLKNEYYVATVVDAYRRIIDGDKLSKKELDLLYGIFNRGGYTDYFTEKNNMFCFNKKENPYSEYEKTAEEKFKSIISNENLDDKFKTPLDIDLNLRIGDFPKISVRCKDRQYEISGADRVQRAVKAPVSRERIKEALMKFANYPFYLRELKITGDKDIFLPVSSLNAIRRKIADCVFYERKIPPIKETEIKKCYRNPSSALFFAEVSNMEQLKWATEEEKIRFVFADVNLLFQNKEELNLDKTVITLPNIIPDSKNEEIKNKLEDLGKYGVKYLCINNIGNFEYSKDFSLFMSDSFNITNSYAPEVFKSKKIVAIGVSSELNLREIRAFCSDYAAFAWGYKRYTMMTIKNCIKKSVLGKCTKKPALMKDRRGEEYVVECGYECRNIIKNPYVTNMSDKVYEMEGAGINYIGLSFDKESIKECKKILSDFIRGNPPDGKFTRGHYYRGVE